MSKRRLLSIATAFAVLTPVGLFVTDARAQVPLASYSVGVINTPEVPPNTGINYGISTPGTLTGTACTTSAYSGCETSNGYALGTAVSATGSTTGGYLTAVAGSQSEITYYYEVLGPDYLEVPLTISGTASTSALGNNAVAVAGIGFSYSDGQNLDTCSSSGPAVVGYCGSQKSSGDLDASYLLPTNTIAYVILTAYGGSGSSGIPSDCTNGTTCGTGSYSALVVDGIEIDPTFLKDNPGISLVFSSNISTTPLPSTWLTLLGGLAGLGLIARRGTRHSTAVIAAA